MWFILLSTIDNLLLKSKLFFLFQMLTLTYCRDLFTQEKGEVHVKYSKSISSKPW